VQLLAKNFCCVDLFCAMLVTCSRMGTHVQDVNNTYLNYSSIPIAWAHTMPPKGEVFLLKN